MAKHGALRALVGDLKALELARLIGLELEELVRVGLDAAGKGWTVPASRVVRRADAERSRPDPSPDQLLARLVQIGRLEGRQVEVARLLLLGETDFAISERLGCSERTAKRTVSDVLARCGVSNRASLLLAIFRDAGTA
jgi:DNA-binding NarL/FixJ family response regulator